MANKRMFSLQIVDSDAFLELPMTSQLLYFHLAMRADDEGFVGNPKRIIRMIGSSEDDFKLLIAKRFLMIFESGVVVIKHWLIHNTIRMDRFNPTTYKKEKSTLLIKENKAYTDNKDTGIPIGNQSATQVKLSKVKLIKVKDKKITSKYVFRGNPCIQDKKTGKYLAFDNGEWLPIDERFLKDIKENV
jgi:hypothetical protein